MIKCLIMAAFLVHTSVGFAMDPNARKAARKVLGKGNFGCVIKSGKVTIDSGPNTGESVRAVVKKPNPGMEQENNFLLEGGMQKGARDALKEKYPEGDLHRHIPKVYKYNISCIKMTMARGVKLGDAYAEFKPIGFLKLTLKVMEFFSALHGVGIAHEDITPSNIMVDPKDPEYFQVIDFGQAGKINERTRRCTGAAGFSAPERSIRNTRVLPEGDIYSLGKILAQFSIISADMPEALSEIINDMTKPDMSQRISLEKAIKRLTNIINLPHLPTKVIKVLPCEKVVPIGYDPILEVVQSDSDQSL